MSVSLETIFNYTISLITIKFWLSNRIKQKYVYKKEICEFNENAYIQSKFHTVVSVSNSPAGISAHQSRNDPFLGFHSAVVFSAPPLTMELNLACFSTRFCLRWDWVDLELISISTKFDSFHRCWLHLHKRRSQLALFSNGCAMIAMHFVPNNTTRFYLYILAALGSKKRIEFLRRCFNSPTPRLFAFAASSQETGL